MAKYVIIVGLLMLGLGLIMSYAPGLLKWFGHLPGDIQIKGDHSSIFIPVTSMIIVSLVITFLLNLFNR